MYAITVSICSQKDGIVITDMHSMSRPGPNIPLNLPIIQIIIFHLSTPLFIAMQIQIIDIINFLGQGSLPLYGTDTVTDFFENIL